MAGAAHYWVLLCAGLISTSHTSKLSSAVFNITKGGLELMRPILTTLSKTQDTFRGSLRSENGRSAFNILGTTGGRLPYSVFGSAENGGSLDFFGRIVSSIKPYLAPLQILTTKASGNASALVWSESEEHQR